MNYSCCYVQGKKLCLVGFSNVDQVGDLDKHKPIIRYTFLVNNGVISQGNKKQTCTMLTMETKFIVIIKL